MKRRWPFILIAAGFFLLLGGFIYDVEMAGIPYQDPTPEMSAHYTRHARIASAIRWCGLGACLFGALAGLSLRAVRRIRGRVSP